MNRTQQDTGRVIGAGLLILLGVALLFGIDFWRWLPIFHLSWPFYIILPGLLFLGIALFGGRSVAGFAIPGAVVTGTGGILLFQEMTNHYESWSYLWGLYPVFVGLALMYMGARTGNSKQAEAGHRLTMIGLGLTVVFGVLMEIIFSGAFGSLVNYALPLLLIGGGAFLLLRPRATLAYDKPKFSDGKRKIDPAAINPELRRRIDEAIAEEDPFQPNA